MGEDTNLLVSILSREALVDAGHDDVLSRHEGKFVVDVAFDNFGVDNESGGDIVQEDEACVGAEVQLWKADASDSAVILKWS